MPGSLVASHRTFPPAGPIRVEHTLVIHPVVFCSMAVSPFFLAGSQPGGLGHPRGYTARSLFPHLLVIPQGWARRAVQPWAVGLFNLNERLFRLAMGQH